jgi:hypothetical protein
MKTAHLFSPRQDRLWLHCLLSFLTIFILALIDNGPGVFTELLRPGVWISLLFMSVFVLFGQAIAREWILIRYSGKHKTTLTCLIGIPLGLLILYFLFYLIKHS